MLHLSSDYNRMHAFHVHIYTLDHEHKQTHIAFQSKLELGKCGCPYNSSVTPHSK